MQGRNSWEISKLILTQLPREKKYFSNPRIVLQKPSRSKSIGTLCLVYKILEDDVSWEMFKIILKYTK